MGSTIGTDVRPMTDIRVKGLIRVGWVGKGMYLECSIDDVGTITTSPIVEVTREWLHRSR